MTAGGAAVRPVPDAHAALGVAPRTRTAARRVTAAPRPILTRQLWDSFIAIVRYLPRAFVVPRVHGRDFFTPAMYHAFLDRIAHLAEDSPRQWGTMSAAQMLHHLNLAVGGALGYYQLPDESYLASRTLFKWVLVDWYSEQPVGLRLPLGFVITPTGHYDFATEQAQLLALLDKAWHTTSASDWLPHCFMGSLSLDEWGKLHLIHIGYHLRQFEEPDPARVA